MHSLPFVYTILKGKREGEGSCLRMADQTRQSAGVNFIAWWVGLGRALACALSHGGPGKALVGCAELF